MAPIDSRENVQFHFVAICSLGALLSMIVVIVGIKLRWFRHRLTFDRLPTAPKNDSPEDSVVVTGFYRKTTDFDNFVAIERPQSLPPIRLDKRSVQRQSRVETHLRRSLQRENLSGDSLEISENHQEDVQIKQENLPNHINEIPKEENNSQNAAKKKAPKPPIEDSNNVEKLQQVPKEAAEKLQEPVGNIFLKVSQTPKIPETEIKSLNPPRVSQKTLPVDAEGAGKRKSGIKGPEVKTKGTKVRVLKQKHMKSKEITIEKKKKDRRPDVEDKILAESATFAPIAIPRTSKVTPEETQPKVEKKKVDREVKTLQFADDDEIIGHSEGYDSWDMVSKHRQSLNHLAVAPPAPKPRARDSVAVHRQKVTPQTIFLDLNEDHPPRTLRDMQKERKKLSLTKDYSDTEA